MIKVESTDKEIKALVAQFNSGSIVITEFKTGLVKALVTEMITLLYEGLILDN